MKAILRILVIQFICLSIGSMIFAQTLPYPWLSETESGNSIINRIPVPKGYERIISERGSFAGWLQNLSLKAGCPPVHLYNGELKRNQTAQAAVINIDVGSRDLQQCADAVIRLRSEYLFSRSRIQDIHFNFTSGHNAKLTQWFQGFRPLVRGNIVNWKQTARADSSYGNFRRYLNTVFMYAGSYSLSRELLSVDDINQIKTGDVFIQGGFPGHAVLVVDMARNRKTGEKIFLLAQSYMPAQDIHILNNPQDSDLSPWYSVNFGEILTIPEWTFKKDDLKRF